MAEDLYKVLGVDRNASEADIKKAYRQLARTYHPDVNKEAGAEAKFKEIQKAYGILSDSQKKAQYDQYGVTDDQPGFGGGGQGFGGFSAESMEDIFDSFFGGGGRGRSSRQQGPRQGEDLRYDLELTLEEVAKGVSKELDIFHMEHCSRCSGSGSQPGTSKTTCSHCQGSGQIRTVQRTMLGNFSQVTTCHHCSGTGQMIKNPCLLCHGKGLEKKKKRIKVEVPAGVETGNKLRVAKEGNFGENGGPPGDLYVFLSVKKHSYFERHDQDIYLEIDIPFMHLLIGTEIEIPTVDGDALLKIPLGTQPNTIMRLKNKGIPNLRGFGRGDQHVKLVATLPEKLSSKEKDLVEQLAVLQGVDLKQKGKFKIRR